MPIKLTNSNRKNSAVAVSNSIPLRGDTRLIALVSEEVIPPDTSIQYSISRDLDDDNSPVNFRQVQPTSREGENKKENFIPIGVRSVVQPITHDTERPNATDWRYIVPEKKYGGRLYPIMDLASQVENFETLQIVDTSLRLFRGLNDWSITREKIVNTDIHQRIPYVPTYNEADQNFAPQPIYIRFSEEITIRDSDRADLRYPPVRTQDHEILDTSFNRTDAVITNFNVNQGTSGTEVIVEGATVATGTRFNITYYTRLQDITDKKTKVILQGSRIYNEAGELRRGIDYDIVDTNDVKEIRFKRGGSYTGANLLADLTVETEDLEKALIFKTLLISTKNLNLIMGPFSKAEIERGNIHRINGQDVSTLTSFPITAGTYLIESTQVDPGVNQFTQRESTAFIRIPFEELEMRGFEDSLRAVPAYDLVINSANDDRQFALADGKIYLNRTPDYTIQRSSSSVGKYLKTTRVTENGEVIGVPEQFRLEFDFIDPAQGETRISVRVEMTNSNGILPASPELKRLGINEFNKNIFK